MCVTRAQGCDVMTVKTSEQPVLQVCGVYECLERQSLICANSQHAVQVCVLLHGGVEDSVHGFQQKLRSDLSQSVQQHL